MAKHMVKCPQCEEIFDREQVECVHIGRRYIHQTCLEAYNQAQANKPQKKITKTKEKDQKLIELEEYICKLFHVEFVPPKIQKQIKQMHTEFNYTYSGMLKSLIYFYEIQGHGDIEKYGQTINIISWVYEDAKKYFYTLYLAQLTNQSLTKEQVKTKIVEYTIPSPQHKKRELKLFTFEEDETK